LYWWVRRKSGGTFGSGSIVSPAPPSTLGRYRLGPRGLPRRASLPSPKLGDVGRRGLSLSYRALLSWLEPLATPAEADIVGSSSHGITRFAPLHRSTVRASTPSGSEELPLGRRNYPATSCSALVVSHHLGGLLRAAAAGLLHPAAGPGVRRVSRCLRPGLPKVPRPVGPFPATRIVPFEGFPSTVAVPHHCGRCPPAVGRQPPRPNPGSDTRPGPALHPRTEVRWRLLRRSDRSRGDGLSPPKRRQRESD
jgi:hypothetical protein